MTSKYKTANTYKKLEDCCYLGNLKWIRENAHTLLPLSDEELVTCISHSVGNGDCLLLRFFAEDFRAMTGRNLNFASLENNLLCIAAHAGSMRAIRYLVEEIPKLQPLGTSPVQISASENQVLTTVLDTDDLHLDAFFYFVEEAPKFGQFFEPISNFQASYLLKAGCKLGMLEYLVEKFPCHTGRVITFDGQPVFARPQAHNKYLESKMPLQSIQKQLEDTGVPASSWKEVTLSLCESGNQRSSRKL